MFKILDKNVTMQRGDSASIETVIFTGDNKIYDPKVGDIIYFQVYKKREDYPNGIPVIKKLFKNRKIILSPEDTRFIEVGEYYYICNIKTTVDLEQISETYTHGRFFLK